MKSKKLGAAGDNMHVLVFDEGDEFSDTMLRFAREQKLTAASFTALGAFQDARLGWFDVDRLDYMETAVDEQVEVLSLVGNVAEHRGEPKVHAHVVLGKRDSTAIGGHLLAAHIRPTLEVTLVESPRHLHRIHDESTGLPLIRPDAPDMPPRGGRSPRVATRAETADDDENAGDDNARADESEPLRQGVGFGMGYSIGKPTDTADWRKCPDCGVWVHGLNRPACPYCGYVFGQQQSRARHEA